MYAYKVTISMWISTENDTKQAHNAKINPVTPHRKLRKFLPNFAVIVAKFCDTTLPKFAKFF